MTIESWIARSLRSGLIPPAALLLLLLAAGCGDDEPSSAPIEDAGANQPGASGEVCSPDKPCTEGLVCSSGKCAAGAALTLTVDPAARGCELALRDAADARLSDVRFGDGVRGSFVHRAPRLGLAFIAAEDEAIASNQVSLVVAGGGTPKLEHIRCVDSKGKALPKATVTVVEP